MFNFINHSFKSNKILNKFGFMNLMNVFICLENTEILKKLKYSSFNYNN